MDKVKTAFQNFGRVIVDPILYLSVTGIILAIATVCSLGSGVVADLGTLLSAATNSAVIGNLPVIFRSRPNGRLRKRSKNPTRQCLDLLVTSCSCMSTTPT